VQEVGRHEGVWNYLKHVELRNLCCDDRPELRGEVRRAVKRLRHKRHGLFGCLTQCGYGPSVAPQARSSGATDRHLGFSEWPDAA
jgi:hypothetical protein